MSDADEDWPRDVIVDLMMHLTRVGYARSSEMLADALITFETERAGRRVSKSPPGVGPVLRVVPGSGSAA